MTVPFLDLRRSQDGLALELNDAWRRVTESARYVGGPLVDEFESAWATSSGVDHAVGVGNGTDALEMALRVLGVGPGDEVVVPANTFIATAEAIVSVGAVPHFADVDPATMLITADSVRAATNSRTAAVVVVHLYGQAADMTALVETCAAAGLALVEDCAQAQGATWRGRPVGSFGALGCTSFYPGKNLGAFGDAGAVVTSDPALAGKLRQLGDHGRSTTSKYEHPVAGRNSRLDALQAAVLLVKLPSLARWNDQRRAAAATYRELLGDVECLRLTDQSADSSSVHHLEVVRVPERDQVRRHLMARGVETGVHYPVPCHLQHDFSRYPRTDLDITETAAGQLLSLPVFPGVTHAEVTQVCSALRDVLDELVPSPLAVARS